jgi:hypothetical protein
MALANVQGSGHCQGAGLEAQLFLRRDARRGVEECGLSFGLNLKCTGPPASGRAGSATYDKMCNTGLQP